MKVHSGNPEGRLASIATGFPHTVPATKGPLRICMRKKRWGTLYLAIECLPAASKTCTLLHKDERHWETNLVWATT